MLYNSTKNWPKRDWVGNCLTLSSSLKSRRRNEVSSGKKERKKERKKQRKKGDILKIGKGKMSKWQGQEK